LETDVCLSSDARLARLHDPWLAIRTAGAGWAHETPSSELRELRLRDASGQESAEAPLLLDELLDLAPDGLVLQLDVKTHGDPALGIAMAEAACRAAARYPGAPGRDHLLPGRGARGGGAGRPPRAIDRVADNAPGTLVTGTRGWVEGVCVEHFLLRSALVDELRTGGLSVATGTVNDFDLALRVARLGVDAITTDCPAELISRARQQAVPVLDPLSGAGRAPALVMTGASPLRRRASTANPPRAPHPPGCPERMHPRRARAVPIAETKAGAAAPEWGR
jgi:glycerophosphoryl diester phosphodiesterase